MTVTNIFKFGNFMYSRLRDIDKKLSVTEKEKTKKRKRKKKQKKEKKKEKMSVAICPFLLRKRAIIIKSIDSA